MLNANLSQKFQRLILSTVCSWIDFCVQMSEVICSTCTHNRFTLYEIRNTCFDSPINFSIFKLIHRIFGTFECNCIQFSPNSAHPSFYPIHPRQQPDCAGAAGWQKQPHSRLCPVHRQQLQAAGQLRQYRLEQVASDLSGDLYAADGQGHDGTNQGGISA